MSSRFILIDHSIEDAAGHYLEYARRVLEAAKAEGFRTVLATNQRAQSIECPEADLVLKPFSNTFWENQALSKFRTLKGFILKSDLMSIQPEYAKKFAEELAALISQVSVAESDLVFIPTLGGTELLGVSLYSASNAAVPVRWHLLFRRDIPAPRSFFDIRSRAINWQVKASFALANAAFRSGVRCLYTDTEELTQQYKSLGVGEFQTLPIPIDPYLGYKYPWQQGPLTVSYLGDLRDEKGIHHLPKIVKALRDEGFDASLVVFIVQGNLPNGTASRSGLRARRVLANKALSGVEVIDGPLSSEGYRDLLLGSDVVLLPYSTTHYAARSSGIYAEAVAAGIPTIHPRDSWMGRNAVGLSNSGYSKTAHIPRELKEVLLDYKKYETASLEFSKKWRTKHSAKKLLQILADNSRMKKF